MSSRSELKPKSSETENDILKNDHSFSAQFVKTGERPQNFIKNVDPSCRYVKYPRAAMLMQEKNSRIKTRNHPPIFINADLLSYDLSSLGKFDVIYCDPPWEEYEKRAKRANLFQGNQKYYKSLTLEALKKINVGEISDSPSFIFLWAGCEHLEDSRELLKEWGFKRCEDIVWVKTNTIRKNVPPQSEDGIFVRVKEHCLMGYQGDSKRAFDHTFIHPNIDIDVVVTEEPEIGSLAKPSQVYDIIERFCLGRKRIELFGTDSNIKNGWLTIGNQIRDTKFDLAEYNSWFLDVDEIPNHFIGGRRMGTTPGIESLRPKEDLNQNQSVHASHTNMISQSNIASQNNINMPSINQLRSHRSLPDDENNGKRSLTKSDSGKYGSNMIL